MRNDGTGAGAFVAPLGTLILLCCATAHGQNTPGFTVEDPLSAELRSEFGFVVVRPGSAAASEHVTGTYGKEGLDMVEGMAKGGSLGRVSRDVGGVPVSVPIPVIGEIGAIVGGIVGARQEAVQSFRDRLTKNLMDAGGKPMSSESLADDVFWLIRGVPSLKTRLLLADQPTPADTDAMLFVNVDSIQISVKDEDAVIMTTATASLMRVSDGVQVFDQQFVYEDRDTLANWTRDDDAAWHSYAAYARHYLAREIAARLYERVEPWASLAPTQTDDIKLIKKNPWAGTTKVATPELSWQLKLADTTVDANAVTYDIEIYDSLQMVYAARGLQTTTYHVPVELDGCKTYRWSVRPMLTSGGVTRYGEWMRLDDGERTKRGGTGIKASLATAYLYDFASFEVKCGRR